MSAQLFDIVFFGIIQAGKDRETVMQNMAILFNTDASKLAPYFAGGRKVIKAGINANMAEKYRASLENVGLVIKIESSDESAKASADQTQQSTQLNSTTTDTSIADTAGLSIAPLGADIIVNPVKHATPEIDDISGLTMAEAGADIITHPTAEKKVDIPDISGLSLVKEAD